MQLAITDVMLALLSAVVGALLGWVLMRWDNWRQTAKRSDLRGEWLALSHGGDQTTVRDKVTISKKCGKLHLVNHGNDASYAYEAFCCVDANNILQGTWRSTRPGSTACGRVLMIVNPQGTSISGVYTGKDVRGTDLILAWVLARTDSDLSAAVASLNKCVQFPQCS
jgi:hypothetical protein